MLPLFERNYDAETQNSFSKYDVIVQHYDIRFNFGFVCEDIYWDKN